MGKAIQTSQSSMSALQRIQMALTQMAIFRGGEMDKTTLSLYSRRLAREGVEDVVAATETIAEMERKEGELRIPEIGAILKVVAAVAVARENRQRYSDEHAYRMWESMSKSYREQNPWKGEIPA